MTSEEKMLSAARAALSAVAEPNLGGDVASAGVADVVFNNGRPQVNLTFPYAGLETAPVLQECIAAAFAAAGLPAPQFSAQVRIHPHLAQGGAERVDGVRNLVAVSSAKGGVGKSAVAVNLAVTLARQGAAVGLLDADIYGPSAPQMTGLNSRPQSPDGRRITPLQSHGVKFMSMGFLVEEARAMIWRGPMATKAFSQLLRDTDWGGVDYLIVDMPPGTGDIQLTLAQRAPVTGAVIVTTPQPLAVADAARGAAMFQKTGIDVLGLVENMAAHTCAHCGHTSHIFGQGGARQMAARFGVEMLGSLPLDESIRAAADNGAPLAAAQPQSAAAKIFGGIAARIGAKIAAKPRDRSAAFGKVAVEN